MEISTSVFLLWKYRVSPKMPDRARLRRTREAGMKHLESSLAAIYQDRPTPILPAASRSLSQN
jgi:hypothetical protein